MANVEAKDLARIVRGLRGVPLFSDLSDRDVRRIAREVAVRTVPAGTTLVEQGDVGVGFFLILDGEVDVLRGGRRIARLGPREFFGEMALFAERVRTASVRSATPTTLAVLSRWEFWGIARDRPALTRALLETMARRVVEADPSPRH